MGPSEKPSSKKTRQRIEEAIAQAEKTRKRNLLHQRIELARKGVLAFSQSKLAEAVIYLKSYLRALEQLKEVKDGGLKPSHFAAPHDAPELLLLAGVYWDLVKIYDRTRSPEKRKEFKHYLDQYISFSKGTKNQSVAAESLRKYIVSRRSFYKKELRAAYLQIATSKCYMATALVDVTQAETLPSLQRFRDQQLSKSWAGRAFIHIYYQVSPRAARITVALPESLRSWLGKKLDQISRRLA